MKNCLSCAIVSGKKEATGGVIAETPFFHAHQDFAYPVPGMVIVASKRHFLGLDEMTEDEAVDFIQLVRQIRSAQRYVLSVEHVYYFYNEDTTHHFHLWMMLSYAWMANFGKSVDGVRPALVYAREHMASPQEMDYVADCAAKLRDALLMA